MPFPARVNGRGLSAACPISRERLSANGPHQPTTPRMLSPPAPLARPDRFGSPPSLPGSTTKEAPRPLNSTVLRSAAVTEAMPGPPRAPLAPSGPDPRKARRQPGRRQPRPCSPARGPARVAAAFAAMTATGTARRLPPPKVFPSRGQRERTPRRRPPGAVGPRPRPYSDTSRRPTSLAFWPRPAVSARPSYECLFQTKRPCPVPWPPMT